MKNGKSILDRIRQKIPEFSAGNRAIAEYISENPDIAAYMTVAELAEASNVSDATVVRFARNLGYSRYSELKAELKYVLRSDVRQIDRLRHSGIAIANQKSPLMQTVEKSMHADMQSIEQTLSDLKEEDIRIIVRKIATAERVFISGTHTEYGLACYFASQLSWIRSDVHLLDATHEPSYDLLSMADEKDVLVAISFPPNPLQTVKMLEAAGRRHSYCIAITDSPLSPLAKRANRSLYAKDLKLFFADNSAPVMSLLSALLGLIGNYNYERSMERLNINMKYWDEIGFYYQDTDKYIK